MGVRYTSRSHNTNSKVRLANLSTPSKHIDKHERPYRYKNGHGREVHGMYGGLKMLDCPHQGCMRSFSRQKNLYRHVSTDTDGTSPPPADDSGSGHAGARDDGERSTKRKRDSLERGNGNGVSRPGTESVQSQVTPNGHDRMLPPILPADSKTQPSSSGLGTDSLKLMGGRPPTPLLQGHGSGTHEERERLYDNQLIASDGFGARSQGWTGNSSASESRTGVFRSQEDDFRLTKTLLCKFTTSHDQL